MSIYTKKGDKGKTSLINGKMLSKSSEIFEILGTVDELNAFLGMVRARKRTKVGKILGKTQNDLFFLGSIIAGVKSKEIWGL